MRFVFERPEWLALLLALVPVVWLAWRSIAHLGHGRAIAAAVVRAAVIVLLAFGLARPSIVRRGEGVSVVVVADASRSVPATQRVQAQAWLAERAKDRPDPADRIGVVTVAKTPEIRSLPSRSGDVDIASHAGDGTATDLAAGLRAAIAVMPADSMHRILLLSDGVDTSGDVMEAAARAATLGIPVDVAALSSPNMADVMVESLRTPARARRGQVIDARVVVRASQPCEGRLRLRVDDRPVDLDARGNSDAMVVKLQAGPNAFSIPLPVDRSGAVRVEAFFEPVDARQNAIVENDRGSSITFVSGEGRVLVVDDGGGSGVEALVQAVRASQLDVEVCGTEGLSRRVASGDFEGIVLVNVPRWSVDADTDRALHASVQGMGCGLMMVGGDHGFGAGGWKDSETAKALPVDMDPPQERKLPAGALALIIDCSGSMASPVAGTGVSQQQIAAEAAIKAIRALSALDEVTVIAFSGDAALSVPLTTCEDLASIEARIRAIASGGGTNLFPALEMATVELAKSHATTKHAIVLTDGQTMGEPSVGMALAQRMASEGVTLSTLAIGDGSNDGLLARLAKAANGRFYAVKDDQSRVAIPQIFIKEAQLVRRSLVWEGQPFEPRRIGTADWMRSISAVPPLRGYVLTGARGEPAQIGLVSAGDPPDPILAWWNHGLGRGVAFTSDLGGRWTPAWATWPGFQPFVGGMVRWMLRPTAPGDVLVRSRLEGDEAIVEVEAVGDTAARVQSAEARVMQPDGAVQSLALRQVAAGRWSGRFAVDQAGAYLVNAAFGMTGAARPVFTQASVSVPYPREFRTVQADPDRMAAIARRTGGRVLQVGDANANLFETQGMPMPESMRQAWDLCVFLAAALFVVDVAVRRLSIEWPMRRAAEAPRDAARVTAAWKQARQRARTNDIVEAGAPADTRSAATAAASAAPIALEEPPPEAAPQPSAEPEPQDDSPMGRLRAARRRAREGGGA